MATAVPPSIFRAYDIRGVCGSTLTPEIAERVGAAIGSEARSRCLHRLAVGRDGRLSGPELQSALIEGLVASGTDVVDVGSVPTPVLYYAAGSLADGGVVVTGSHNPPDYNGFKIVLGGETLAGPAIAALRERIETGALLSGRGCREEADVIPAYTAAVLSDIRLKRTLRVVVDGGNGVAGPLGSELPRRLGCEVTPLYCDIDGRFPHHHPDPSCPENMQALAAAVRTRGADLGLAFDGDGDRLGVVDRTGRIIWPDQLLALFAREVLGGYPSGRVVYDVKCSRLVPRAVAAAGGEPVIGSSGHSPVKALMNDVDAVIGGELTGHLYFRDRWFGFDDALYAAARLLELVTNRTPAVLEELPSTTATPEIHVAMSEGAAEAFMRALRQRGRWPGARVTTVDGIRVDYDDGWGLVRASNTTPSLSLRFEGDDADALTRVRDRVRTVLEAIDPSRTWPF